MLFPASTSLFFAIASLAALSYSVTTASLSLWFALRLASLVHNLTLAALWSAVSAALLALSHILLCALSVTLLSVPPFQRLGQVLDLDLGVYFQRSYYCFVLLPLVYMGLAQARPNNQSHWFTLFQCSLTSFPSGRVWWIMPHQNHKHSRMEWNRLFFNKISKKGLSSTYFNRS